MTNEPYVPFSDLQAQPAQSSSITDIEEYKPANAQSNIQNCNPVLTHCYICGAGWGYGYWKHCGCNTVPAGDGLFPLTICVTIYLLYKYFKRN